VADNETYMQRCLELAQNGLGKVAPNPMVGCVIVHKNTIIAEGFHNLFGGPHAEINALDSVKNREILPDCTLYVNLEPCCHYGKTPPCTDRIIAEGLGKVVIGMKDPFAKVAGNGIKALQNAGIIVESGILEADCLLLNRRFVRFHSSFRPYVILKWAQTPDGFIDKERESSEPQINWITDEKTRILVHKWRTEEQAVMIGGNTARKDDPRLTARDWIGRDPVRIVIDHDGSLDTSLHVFDEDAGAETIVFTSAHKTFGKHTRTVITDFSGNALPFIFKTLYENNIQSVIIEGGKQLLTSVIETGLWDEARIFIGNRYFFKGVEAPKITGKVYSIEHIGQDTLTTMINDLI
jgi:diaminohydroxyphosphoribosylaminopyrimidine deaminase / 5-amino-6-(5-phosphoribosylamino)uracil reductase